MEVIDHNGEGRWSRSGILSRYAELSKEQRIRPRDLSPMEHSQGDRRWVFPVMNKVIEGIEAGDTACIWIGIEFIEEDTRFPFGKTLKANTARALRRAPLTEEQKRRIRRRVFTMLRRGLVPREFHEYAKLVRAIGFDADDIPAGVSSNRFVERYRSYFNTAVRASD
jgi:hypothetical protein